MIHGKNKFHVAAVDLAPRLVRVLKQNMGRIMHAFKRFDVNGDGELDRQEFGEMLEKFASKNDEIDITKQDIDMIFHFFDRDGGEHFFDTVQGSILGPLGCILVAVGSLLDSKCQILEVWEGVLK